jgi:hypothetical protein
MVHLKAREVRATAGGRARLGHHDIPAVPRHFYVHLRTSDLTTLSMPPRHCAGMQLKVSTHAPFSVPLRNGEFYEYVV